MHIAVETMEFGLKTIFFIFLFIYLFFCINGFGAHCYTLQVECDLMNIFVCICLLIM